MGWVGACGIPMSPRPMTQAAGSLLPYGHSVIAQDATHAASAIGDVDGFVGAHVGGRLGGVEEFVVTCRYERGMITAHPTLGH